MLIFWIGLGALLFYWLQASLYERFWNKGLRVTVAFDRESAVEGEECALTETIDNGKLLPLPVLKVKFVTSRNLRFQGDGDGAVTDQYYRNDMISLMPWQRVVKRLPFLCRARGYYHISDVDLVCADLFLDREMTGCVKAEKWLYVYPAWVESPELDQALQNMNGEILTKRHLLEDPFEYRGIREYAPFDEMKSVNWKATARTGELMVNMKNYTSLKAVRVFLNLEDGALLRQVELLELSIRIGARIAGAMLEQGIRVALYANGRDLLNGEPVRMEPSAGREHRVSVNRMLSRIDLERKAAPFEDTFAEQLYEAGEDTYTVFVSADMQEDFQKVLRRQDKMGRAFIWFCPLHPRMEELVENAETVHFRRLDAEVMLREG